MTKIIEALDAYDAFFRGDKLTRKQKDLAKRVAVASAFGAAAYNRGIDPDQATHAMVRSVLVAIQDPMHSDLDYLRQCNSEMD